MQITISLDYETTALLKKRAALLEQIQKERSQSGAIHPRGQEFDELTTNIQMRLGNLAFEQAIKVADKAP